MNFTIYIYHIYPNGSFIIANFYLTKSAFIEYNSAGISQTTLIDHKTLYTRIPSDKIFLFEKMINELNKSDNEMQAESIQIILNGKLLKGLSQYISVNFDFVEVNESGNIVIAIAYDNFKNKPFIYDLENDYYWYILDVLPNYFNSI